MEITVKEIGTLPNSTASQMFVDGKLICFVIEDGMRETKIPGETRIPGGRYLLAKRTHGGFFQKYRQNHRHDFAIEVLNVPNFKDILIHIGNTALDTRGCLLVNSGIMIGNKGEYSGIESTTAYLSFYAMIRTAFNRGEDVYLDVQRNFG